MICNFGLPECNRFKILLLEWQTVDNDQTAPSADSHHTAPSEHFDQDLHFP